MTANVSGAVANRVVERRRAVALARHYREAEGLSNTQIADRLGRSLATIKAYFYDPTGREGASCQVSLPGAVSRLRRLHAAARWQRTCVRLFQGLTVPAGLRPAVPCQRVCLTAPVQLRSDRGGGVVPRGLVRTARTAPSSRAAAPGRRACARTRAQNRGGSVARVGAPGSARARPRDRPAAAIAVRRRQWLTASPRAP